MEWLRPTRNGIERRRVQRDIATLWNAASAPLHLESLDTTPLGWMPIYEIKPIEVEQWLRSQSSENLVRLTARWF